MIFFLFCFFFALTGIQNACALGLEQIFMCNFQPLTNNRRRNLNNKLKVLVGNEYPQPMVHWVAVGWLIDS